MEDYDSEEEFDESISAEEGSDGEYVPSGAEEEDEEDSSDEEGAVDEGDDAEVVLESNDEGASDDSDDIELALQSDEEVETAREEFNETKRLMESDRTRLWSILFGDQVKCFLFLLRRLNRASARADVVAHLLGEAASAFDVVFDDAIKFHDRQMGGFLQTFTSASGNTSGAAVQAHMPFLVSVLVVDMVLSHHRSLSSGALALTPVASAQAGFASTSSGTGREEASRTSHEQHLRQFVYGDAPEMSRPERVERLAGIFGKECSKDTVRAIRDRLFIPDLPVIAADVMRLKRMLLPLLHPDKHNATTMAFVTKDEMTCMYQAVNNFVDEEEVRCTSGAAAAGAESSGAAAQRVREQHVDVMKELLCDGARRAFAELEDVSAVEVVTRALEGYYSIARRIFGGKYADHVANQTHARRQEPVRLFQNGPRPTQVKTVHRIDERTVSQRAQIVVKGPDVLVPGGGHWAHGDRLKDDDLGYVKHTMGCDKAHGAGLFAMLRKALWTEQHVTTRRLFEYVQKEHANPCAAELQRLEVNGGVVAAYGGLRIDGGCSNGAFAMPLSSFEKNENPVAQAILSRLARVGVANGGFAHEAPRYKYVLYVSGVQAPIAFTEPTLPMGIPVQVSYDNLHAVVEFSARIKADLSTVPIVLAEVALDATFADLSDCEGRAGLLASAILGMGDLNQLKNVTSGRTLTLRLDEQKLPPDVVLVVASQASSGQAPVWTAHVLHYDELPKEPCLVYTQRVRGRGRRSYTVDFHANPPRGARIVRFAADFMSSSTSPERVVIAPERYGVTSAIFDFGPDGCTFPIYRERHFVDPNDILRMDTLCPFTTVRVLTPLPVNVPWLAVPLTQIREEDLKPNDALVAAMHVSAAAQAAFMVRAFTAEPYVGGIDVLHLSRRRGLMMDPRTTCLKLPSELVCALRDDDRAKALDGLTTALDGLDKHHRALVLLSSISGTYFSPMISCTPGLNDVMPIVPSACFFRNGEDEHEYARAFLHRYADGATIPSGTALQAGARTLGTTLEPIVVGTDALHPEHRRKFAFAEFFVRNSAWPVDKAKKFEALDHASCRRLLTQENIDGLDAKRPYLAADALAPRLVCFRKHEKKNVRKRATFRASVDDHAFQECVRVLGLGIGAHFVDLYVSHINPPTREDLGSGVDVASAMVAIHGMSALQRLVLHFCLERHEAVHGPTPLFPLRDAGKPPYVARCNLVQMATLTSGAYILRPPSGTPETERLYLVNTTDERAVEALATAGYITLKKKKAPKRKRDEAEETAAM